MLDRETYLENLRSQFRDDIKMIIQECQEEWKTYLDVDKLNSRLSALHSSSLVHGLSEDDWMDLMFEITPEIYDQLDFGVIAA